MEGLLNALAEFLDLENAQRTLRAGRRGLPQVVLGVVDHVPLMPCLQEILAVVDRNPVKPGAHRGLTAKFTEFAISLEEDVMRGVFRLRWITQESQGQVVNLAGVFLVNRAEFGRGPRRRSAGRGRPLSQSPGLEIGDRLGGHKRGSRIFTPGHGNRWCHRSLDRTLEQKSRREKARGME